MAVLLDHTIVPARDKKRSAELLAKVLDVRWSDTWVGPFCPVYVNEGLTLDFDECEGELPVQHYCFRVGEAEFDQIVQRLRELQIAYRSTPDGVSDGEVNTRHGGRIIYWSEPDGHVWEALTVSYARQPNAPYHAHIYYDLHDRDPAARLHRHLSTVRCAGEFADVIFVGEMRDANMGPHPKPQFEVHFLEGALPAVRALIEKSGLTALLHPLTHDDLADHTSLGVWVGEPLPLDLSVLDPPGMNQGIARFGKTDF